MSKDSPLCGGRRKTLYAAHASTCIALCRYRILYIDDRKMPSVGRWIEKLCNSAHVRIRWLVSNAKPQCGDWLKTRYGHVWPYLVVGRYLPKVHNQEYTWKSEVFKGTTCMEIVCLEARKLGMDEYSGQRNGSNDEKKAVNLKPKGGNLYLYVACLVNIQLVMENSWDSFYQNYPIHQHTLALDDTNT